MSQVSAAYDAALQTATAFNRSTVGKVSLIGPDAVQFIHNLCTNDVKNLAIGDGCEAYLCDPRAKVQHQLWITRVDNGIWIETVPGRATELFKTLDRYLISERLELTDETDSYAQFHIAGPGAAAALEKRFGSLPVTKEFSSSKVVTQSSVELHISRHDILSLPGYNIRVRRSQESDLKSELAAVSISWGNDFDFETLRIEAGSPIYGIDIDDTRFVMEVANAARAVSFSKGCFPGQEPIVMSRDRAGFVNRAFLCMKVLNGSPLSHGTKLMRANSEVGIITSSINSPRLKAPIALGYIKRGNQEKGTILTAGDQEVEVLGFPPLS